MQLYSINQTELAQKIGVSKMTISHIMSETGRGGGFKQETIDAIKHAFPTIDINWLITGVGTAPLPIDETSLFSQPIQPSNEPNHTPYDQPKSDEEKVDNTNTRPLGIGPNTLIASNEEYAPYNQPQRDIEYQSAPREVPPTQRADNQIESHKEKQITKIVIFYSDGTFKDYRPE